MDNIKLLLLKKLLEHYSNPMMLKLIYEISTMHNIISLRILEYFLTSYCNYWNNGSIDRKIIKINGKDIYNEYKQHLSSYNKKKFDAFKRKERILLFTEDLYEDGSPIHLLKDWDKIEKLPKINLKCICTNIEKDDKRGIVTTIAQLNFFKWCIENGILGYIYDNSEDILDHMKKHKKFKEEEKKRREQKKKIQIKLK